MISKTNMMNDEEKTAAILARTQINYLKQYEYRGFDRLNLNWWNICPEVYNHPNNRDHKYTITCTVMPGYYYINEDTNDKIIDDNGQPRKKDNQYLITIAEKNNQTIGIRNGTDTLASCEIPDKILKDLNIIPVKVTITWQQTINNHPINKTYEIINYYLGSPRM